MSASDEADKPVEQTEPAAEKRGRGRPEFSPRKSDREQVEVMAAAGCSEIEISRSLKITPPTLRKHFADELADGWAQKRADMIMAMYKAGISGNVSAQKAYLALGDTVYRVPEAPKAEETPPKEKPLGKKEAAEFAARHPDISTSMGELMARRMTAVDDGNVH